MTPLEFEAIEAMPSGHARTAALDFRLAYLDQSCDGDFPLEHALYMVRANAELLGDLADNAEQALLLLIRDHIATQQRLWREQDARVAALMAAGDPDFNLPF